jgi:hypothetical protein
MECLWRVEYGGKMGMDFIQEGRVVVGLWLWLWLWLRHLYYKAYEIELDKFYLFDYTRECPFLTPTCKVVAVLLTWVSPAMEMQ